jgi:hypothetical protein
MIIADFELSFCRNKRKGEMLEKLYDERKYNKNETDL